MDRKTDTHTQEQRVKPICRQTDGQIDRRMYRWKGSETKDRLTYGQRDGQIDRHIYKWTDSQTNG